MTKRTHTLIYAVISMFALAYCGAASALTVVGDPASQTISVGETTTVSVLLDVEESNQLVSRFFGAFTLAGLNTVAEVNAVDVGNSWPNAQSGIVDDELYLTLASANTYGDRLLASLSVTGLSEGIFAIVLQNPNVPGFTTAQVSIPSFPFELDLVLDNTDSEVLGVINVVAPVPVPFAGLLFASALGILPWLRKRTR